MKHLVNQFLFLIGLVWGVHIVVVTVTETVVKSVASNAVLLHRFVQMPSKMATTNNSKGGLKDKSIPMGPRVQVVEIVSEPQENCAMALVAVSQ